MRHDPTYLTLPQLAAVAELDLITLRDLLWHAPLGILFRRGEEEVVEVGVFMEWLRATAEVNGRLMPDLN